MPENGAELTALEAGFLYLENPDTPLHVGSLAIYDGNGWRDARGSLRMRALQRHVVSRVVDLARLRQHPVQAPARVGRPRWTDDTDFDIRRHVRSIRLTGPGDEQQLLALMEDLQSRCLDRSHPLWELWFVDGLADGRVAVIEKIHHALVDGIGGVDLAMMLLDTTPETNRPPVVAVPGPATEPSRLALLGGAVSAAAKEPFLLGQGLLSAAAHPIQSAAEAKDLAEAAASLIRSPVAPRSSLNAPIGGRREYRIIRRSLTQTRNTAHALGGTVNEVILAAVTAGLRELLSQRGEDMRGRALHALVPVSVRRADEHQDLGNRVAAMIVPLPTDQPDAGLQFSAVRRASRTAKQHHQAELSTAFLSISDHWPEPVLAAAVHAIGHQRLVNLVVTNVPGPPVPLYLMGARMLEVFPQVPLAGNLTVSIGILSYGDQLSLGVWADRRRCPDLGVLVDAVEGGFSALDDLARTPSHKGATSPTPAERR